MFLFEVGDLASSKLSTDDEEMKQINIRKGSLTVVGTGITARFHISAEAIAALKYADQVLYLVSDDLTERWIRKLKPTSRSLANCYDESKDRIDSYTEMVQIILDEVRKGRRVCAAFYGHPGVGVYPSREAIRIARVEGFEARMQPGISAKDCLFADLGIDPLDYGCQSFEATDFVLHKRVFEPRSDLILWQVGVLANCNYKASGMYDLQYIPVLQEMLMVHYPPSHQVILYAAATVSFARPEIRRMQLRQLSKSSFHGGYTMYVPPMPQTKPDPGVIERLGLQEDAR